MHVYCCIVQFDILGTWPLVTSWNHTLAVSRFPGLSGFNMGKKDEGEKLAQSVIATVIQLQIVKCVGWPKHRFI